MSIPPLLSRSPPPIYEISDEDDNDFGNFVVNNDLSVDISQGEILEKFEKAGPNTRYEDTTSEDSGLCMGSIGQTQSPCENSPILSAYIQSGSNKVSHEFVKTDMSFPVIESNNVEKNLPSNGLGGIENNTDDKYQEELQIDDCPVINGSPSTAKSDESVSYKCTVESPEQEAKMEEQHNENEQNIPADDYINDSYVHNCISPKTDNEHFDDYSTFDDEFTNFESCKHFSNNDATTTMNNEIIDSDFKTEDFVLSTGVVQNIVETQNNDDAICVDSKYLSPTHHEVIENIVEAPYNIVHHVDEIEKLNEATITNSILSIAPTLNLSLCKSHNSNCTASMFSLRDDGISVVPDSNSVIADEDFSDFTDFQSCASGTNVDDVPQSEKTPQELWTEFWPDLGGPQKLILNLQSELENSQIWLHLCQLELSPALSYQWGTSVSNCKLLSALNIDSRNILFGPWNKYKFSSNEGCAIMDSIKSIKIGETIDLTEVTTTMKDPVPDAHFDWDGSGLINPLDSTQENRRHHEEIHTTDITKLSKTAHDILHHLPNLSFMRKPFIVFPKCAS